MISTLYRVRFILFFTSTLFFASIISNNIYAQLPTHMLAQMTDSIYQEYTAFTAPSGLFQQTLDNYNATQEIAFPGAETYALQKVLTILCPDSLDMYLLKADLMNLGAFSLLDIEHEYQTLGCSNPATYNDPGSLATNHLEKMQLPCAWTITKGDPSIKIAILDVFAGTSGHTDLPNLTIAQNHVCSGSNFANCSHGIAVAGGAGAEHNSFCVAGAAPDATINGYCVGSSCTGVWPFKALWDAYLDGNKIINVSATGIGNSTIAAIQIEEMVANGVVLTVSAYGTSHSVYANIPGVINVAQMDLNGNFVQYASTQETNVDIGVNILDLYRLQVNNTCSLGTGNASMAAPHVAGTVALMMDVNPCITPEEIELILEQTSVPAINGDDPGENWYQKTDGGQMDAYEAVLAASQISSGRTVQFDEIWEIPQSFSGDIIVKNGATLTINAPQRFTDPYAGITVEQGGRLIVDGTRLTVGCNNSRWDGIEVLGNPSSSQFLGTSQGIVELKNGATIEFANIGVSLHRRHPVILGGGILEATDANFINNQRAISIWGYENFVDTSPPIAIGNLSTINNCTFVIDENFPAEAFSYPEFTEHIGIFESNGILITNSSFKDERTTEITTPYDNPTGFGIETLNGGFVVDNCSFEGLVYGIIANTVNSTYTFRINNSSFSGNYHGIHTRGINNFEVRGNNFDVGGFERNVDGITDINTQVGLFLDYGTGFVIRENTFAEMGEDTDNIGICSKNTNLQLYGDNIIGQVNEIYANQYDDLMAGNVANGINQAFFSGLVYICNDNGESQANEIDFIVVDGEIATFQLDPNDFNAAGNTFSIDPSCSTTFRHIDNSDDDANSINYFYNPSNSDEEPECFPTNKLIPIAANENECSLDGIIEGDYPNSQRDSIKTFAEGEETYFDGIYANYTDSLNGGDTGYLINLFDNLSSSHVNTLLNKLDQISPYLSGEIIRRVVDENLFSNSQKIGVLEDNPEEIRRYYNWEYIENSGIFTSQELATLQQAKKSITTRDSVERVLTGSVGRLHQSVNGLIISFLHDTTGISLDSVRYCMAIKNDLRGDLSIVDSYLQEKDTTSAFQMLDSIEQNYDLSIGYQNEYDQLRAFYDLHKDIIAKGVDWSDLDQTQLSNLTAIAAYDLTLAGVRSQSILNVFYDEGKYHEPILNNSGGGLPYQGNTDEIPQVVQPNALDYISAFPNPVRDWVTFEYRLPMQVSTCELIVRNMKGQTVRKFELDGSIHRFTWQINDLPDGIYSYTLLLPDGLVKTNKLVILRN